MGRTAAYEGGIRTFLARYSASLYCFDLHRHRLLPGKSDVAGVESSCRHKWIDLRDDRLPGDELYRHPAFSDQEEVPDRLTHLSF